MFGRATITLGIGPRSSLSLIMVYRISVVTGYDFVTFVDFVIASGCYCTWQPRVQCCCNNSVGQCICGTSKLLSWWKVLFDVFMLTAH